MPRSRTVRTRSRYSCIPSAPDKKSWGILAHDPKCCRAVEISQHRLVEIIVKLLENAIYGYLHINDPVFWRAAEAVIMGANTSLNSVSKPLPGLGRYPDLA